MTLAWSNEMSNDASQPPLLPQLGDLRPSRVDDPPSQDGGASAPLTLAAADPEAAPSFVPSHPIRQTASMLAACAAHLLVLLALISAPPTEFGEGGHALDAISVSIIPASALDARQPTSDVDAGAAPAHIAPNPGEDSTASVEASDRSAPPEQKTAPQTDKPAEFGERLAAPIEPAPEAVPDDASEVTSTPAPPEAAKVAAAEPPTVHPPEKEEAPREDDPVQPSPAAPAAGGATSHGSAADQPPRPAAAAASRGEINAYGMAVQSALLAVDQREAKARVSASQVKGTVIVRLLIDAGGALERAEVVQSSGRPQLDEAALLLIRLAAFPPPPPSLTAAERTYLAPIRFR